MATQPWGLLSFRSFLLPPSILSNPQGLFHILAWLELKGIMLILETLS